MSQIDDYVLYQSRKRTRLLLKLSWWQRILIFPIVVLAFAKHALENLPFLGVPYTAWLILSAPYNAYAQMRWAIKNSTKVMHGKR